MTPGHVEENAPIPFIKKEENGAVSLQNSEDFEN